jgi:uncharacterized protein DUF2283
MIMKSNIAMKYDLESDTLYVDTCSPYAEQESDEIAAGVVARFSPSTGEIENLEVLFFRQRATEGKPFTIPVTADLRLAV